MRILQALELYNIPYNKQGACAGIASTAAYYNTNGKIKEFLNILDLLHHDIRINDENIFVSFDQLASDMGYDIQNFNQLYHKANDDPDNPEYAEFLELVEQLENKYLINALNEIESKRFQQDGLSETEQLLLSVKPFLESIAIFQDEQNISKANQLINKSNVNCSLDQEVHLQAKGVKIFNRQSMLEYLEGLLTKPGNSVHISNIGHRINLSFDGEKYYLVDHDEVIIKDNIRDLLGYIGLAMTPNDEKEIIVNVELMASTKPVNGIEKSFEDPLIENISNAAGDSSLLKLALEHGYDEAVSAYLETIRTTNMPLDEKFKLCYAEILGKFAGVATAMIRGETQTVKAYFEKINQFDFTSEQFEPIYRGKVSNSNYCVLDTMIYLNQYEMVDIYIESLLNSKLDFQSQLKLLSPYESIEMGLSIGNYKAVDVFINATRNIELGEQTESLKSLYSIYKDIKSKLDSGVIDSNGVNRLWSELSDSNGAFMLPNDSVATLANIKHIINEEANPQGFKSVTNLFFRSDVTEKFYQHIQHTI
ncbi:MAG: hypothetical protein EP298_06065 [Gammaproteobacteria bacterium]|nr:MAG: hypothetical protein EP298_06065 [Gammaproteobacteria bacterium]UTW41476.1 hypothetical protein KFE69_08110 [bacterium SCSIO 12844]